MVISEARLVGVYVDVSKMLSHQSHEYAFIGRSNVGKSTLINALTGYRKLAHTSSTPGKTQTINLYSINNDAFYLVDLPGYGYASKSKTTLKEFIKIIQEYFTKRTLLTNTYILIDSRIPLQMSDITLIQFLEDNSKQYSIVITKTDKLNNNQLLKHVDNLTTTLQHIVGHSVLCYVTSASKKIGINDLLKSFI